MSNLQLPKISLITVSRNAEQTIERTIRSVVEQNYPNLDYIIIDGGSTDDTVAIIKKYESSITYWHSQSDGGPSYAHNMGFQKASGDLIGFVMADDWLEPGILQRLATAYLKNPNVDIFTCYGQIVQKQNNAITIMRQFTHSHELYLDVNNICKGIPLICMRFFNPALLKKVGLFLTNDANGKNLISCDTEWLLRCLRYKPSQHLVPYLGMTYCSHDQSMTFGKNMDFLKRIHREHLMHAEQYANDSHFTVKQQKRLRQWYCNQAIRLIYRELQSGNFLAALDVVKTILLSHRIRWFVKDWRFS